MIQAITQLNHAVLIVGYGSEPAGTDSCPGKGPGGWDRNTCDCQSFPCCRTPPVDLPTPTSVCDSVCTITGPARGTPLMVVCPAGSLYPNTTQIGSSKTRGAPGGAKADISKWPACPPGTRRTTSVVSLTTPTCPSSDPPPAHGRIGCCNAPCMPGLRVAFTPGRHG